MGLNKAIIFLCSTMHWSRWYGGSQAADQLNAVVPWIQGKTVFECARDTDTERERERERGESVVCSSITDAYSSASWIVIGYIPHKNRLHPHLGSKDHLLLFLLLLLRHLGTMLIEGSIPCIFEETPPNKRALFFHVLWNNNMLNKYFIKPWAQVLLHTTSDD